MTSLLDSGPRSPSPEWWIPSPCSRAEDTGVTHPPPVAGCKHVAPFLFPITARTQRSIIMSAAAPPLRHPDSSTCHHHLPIPPTPSHPSHFRGATPPSFSQASGSQAPGRWWLSQMELNRLVPQLSAMQIALSAESFCAKTGSNLFCLMPSFFDFCFFPFFFFSCRCLIVMSLSAAPLLLSVMPQTCRLFTCLPLLVLFVSPAGLPPLLHGLLQHLQHPHAVSASRSSVWKLPLPLLQAKLDKCRLLFFFSKSFQRELRWWKCQPYL